MKYYVYELFIDTGEVVYVGKGSGARLAKQRREKHLEGREVARFWDEEDAYSFEVEHIAELRPCLNVHPGGNGPRVGASTAPAKTSAREAMIYARVLASAMLAKYMEPATPWAAALNRAMRKRSDDFIRMLSPKVGRNDLRRELARRGVELV